MAATQSRYLGVQPFKTSDKHIFFGRDEDIENLHDFIVLEKLIVLFGKSGYGKSSLLNAGIVPKLIDDKQPLAFRFRPVEVRLGTFIEAQSFSPTETMKRLLENVPITQESNFLNNLTDGETLWLHFKQRQAASNGQFVLIFDQFEEFFSYPIAQQEMFRRQLAEVLYADIPQSVRARLDELTDEQRRYVVKPMNIKAVFAIRSDRMSLLDSMKDTLPAILHKRYELRPLTLSQAKDAITKPARIVSEHFSSPPFEYTEGGLTAILNALTQAPSQPPPKVEGLTPPFGGSGGLGIEAFQLQIVCEYIESLVKEGKVPDLDGNGLPDITEEQLPHMETLYSEYYYRKLQELDPSVKAAAQIVLEDGLLAEDNVTGEGRRMSVDSRALIGQFRHLGLTDDLLLALEKTYLIRREVNTVGGFSFEISHDTLVAPIQKAKKDRKYIEEKALAAQKAAEREEQLAEAKRQADIERNRRRRSNIALLVAVLGLLFAAWQYFNAEQAKKEAQDSEAKAIEKTLAATISDSLARVSRDTALLQKNIADEKTIEADLAATEADRQKVAALLANKNTEKALSELKITSEQAVTLLIAELDRNILRLEYDSTFLKCQTALNLKAQANDVKKRILEITYWYTETDSAEAAIKTLNLIKQTGFNANAPNIIRNLKSEIRNLCPPQYFTFLEERYYPKMIHIEGGANHWRYTYDENDKVKDSAFIKVNSFSMAETESTVWQYFLFQRATKHREPSTPTWQWKGDNPIVSVSWYDATFYLNWLSERRGLQKGYELSNKTGNEPYISYDVFIDDDKKGYRLPTEAEWEFAARGGMKTNDYKFSGSNDVEEVAWYRTNSKSQTHSVRTKKANELGLFDMSGNVWEWCNDWYAEYDLKMMKNPRGAKEGSSRVIRGGSWDDVSGDCRVSDRYDSNPDDHNDGLGFRCVRYD